MNTIKFLAIIALAAAVRATSLTAQAQTSAPAIILPNQEQVAELSLDEQLLLLTDMLKALEAWHAALERPSDSDALNIGGDTWTPVATPVATDGMRLAAQSMESGTNWLRLRIFVPVFEQGSQPTFFLEVTSAQPNTSFEILTTSRLVGGLWIGVPRDQPLNTGPNKVLQYQAVKLQTAAQFYRAQVVAGN